MSAIDQLLREPAAQAIGWALLHFIWQGTLVAFLTAIALACLRKGAADIRYVVSAIGLSLMLTLPAVTTVQLWSANGSSGVSVRGDATTRVAQSATVAGEGAKPGQLRGQSTGTASATSSLRLIDSMRVEPWLPMLVLTWICGVLILSLRLVM